MFLRTSTGRQVCARLSTLSLLAAFVGLSGCGAGDSPDSGRQANNEASETRASALVAVGAAEFPPSRIMEDPQDQSVLQGEMAIFSAKVSVAGSDLIRWVSLGGASVPALCTRTRTYALSAYAEVKCYAGNLKQNQSGAQFAVQLLRDGAVIAESRPATLSVTLTRPAPSMVENPMSQLVPAGAQAVFRAKAAGSGSVRAWEWAKDGVAIAADSVFGYEVRVPTSLAEAGTSHTITLRVRYANGSVDAEPATLTIAAPTTVIGTAGGGVPGPAGSSLGVPAGALSQQLAVGLSSQSVPADLVPAGSAALGDLLVVSPANLALARPAELRLAVPTTVPQGMAIAVQRLEDGAALAGKSALSVQAHTGTRAGTQALSLPSTMRCVDPQDATSGGTLRTQIVQGGTYLARWVAANDCQFDTQARAAEPSTTDQPCLRDQDYALASEGRLKTLVSRHVDCRLAIVDEPITADLVLGTDGKYKIVSDPTNLAPDAFAVSYGYGNLRIESRLSVSGPANALTKRARLELRVPGFTPSGSYPDTAPRFQTVTVRPVLRCGAPSEGSVESACSTEVPEMRLPVTGAAGRATVEFNIAFRWTASADKQRQPHDLETFDVELDRLEYRFDGGSYASLATPGEKNWLSLQLGTLPTLRCDRGVAQTNTRGCVFVDAAPVYVLSRTDPAVAEAAAHIQEAQNGTILFPGTQASPGRFLMQPGTRAIADASVRGSEALQRLKDGLTARNINRKASCEDANSLFVLRQPPRASSACQLNAAECQCDEYPFAATWNGGGFGPNRTSVKLIDKGHNSRSGAALPGFSLRERVLDLNTYPLPGGPNPGSVGGDDFWVFIRP